MSGLTIGQVAKQTHLSHDTLRLYERMGLIEEPPRMANNYRQYPEETITRVKFIIRAKDMGFTLKEIGEILAIRKTSNHTCDEVRKKAESKRQQTLKKIDELKRLEVALSTLISTCETHDHHDLCPILSALEQADKKEE